MQEKETDGVIDPHEVPEAIQWLLGAFRLVDLHDSGRTPGSTTQSIPLARPGNEQQGLWLDVGLLLLNYLVEKDLEQPGNYASIRPFVEELAQRHDALCEEDILFVVRQLSRPTEVWMRPGERDENRRRYALYHLMHHRQGHCRPVSTEKEGERDEHYETPVF